MSGILTGISSGDKPPAAGGIGTQTVTDNFNRADESIIGGNWSSSGSSGNFYKLSSNTITPNQLAQDAWGHYNAWTSGDNQYAQAEITVSGTGSDIGPGVIVRKSSVTATETFYRLIINASGTITLSKHVAGAYTVLATRSVTYAATKKLGLSVNGTTLKIWYDGTQQGASVTDSAISTGFPGVGYSSTVSSVSIDNWDAGTA